MELLLSFIGGFIFARVNSVLTEKTVKKTLKEVWEYFASPINGNMELGWSVRQFLNLINEKAAQRWYESKVHLDHGVFISLLCTFGFLYIVRYSFMYTDGRGVSEIRYFHGFRTFSNLKKVILNGINEAHEKNKQTHKDSWYFQTFVTGHNVLHDYMYY